MGRFILVLFVMFVMASTANASIIININQVGNDVVAKGSGSVASDAGLNFLFNFDVAAQMLPNQSYLLIGTKTQVSTAAWGGLTVDATPFGASTGQDVPDLGTGDVVYGLINKDRGWLMLPASYQWGSDLPIATTTWSNRSLADLGLVVGTHTWTWNAGAQSITLNVNDSAAVPEPSTYALLTMGFGGMMFFRRKKARA